MAVVIVGLAASAAPARAQFYVVPGPYDGTWGGYGGWGSTVQGDVAWGLGVWAAGAGAYNALTAQAEAIDAATLFRSNQYLFLAQRDANRRYWGRQRARQDEIVAVREATRRRLRERPDAHDVNSGNALNMVLDDLETPRISLHNLKWSKARLDGSLVRDLPLQYAPAAITITVASLLSDRPPAALTAPGAADQGQALAGLAARLRADIEGRTSLPPEALVLAIEQVRAARAQLETVLPPASPARREAETYLEGLAILCGLLGSPAAPVFRAGTGGRPETDLVGLIEAMELQGFRFGVARTPRQRSVYAALYPLLASLRDEAGVARGATRPHRPRRGDLAAAGSPATPLLDPAISRDCIARTH
jgi:hypothetical protein